MKKQYIIVIMIFVFSLQLTLIQAYNYPTIVPYVNDFTHTLTQTQIDQLTQHATKIEQNTSYEIAIVLVNTTEGDDRLDYANHIGENNGVGKKATGSGLVVLWTFQNERGLAIATARGSGEIYVNDAKAGEIARAARPLMEDGKYYEGLDQILTELELTIKERDTNATKSGNVIPSLDNGLLMLIIIFGASAIIIWLILRKSGVIGGGESSWAGTAIGTGLGSIGSSGGGTSFGGASFGGGGGRG